MKKVLVFMVASMLTASLFVGCGNEAKEASDAATETTDSDAAETEQDDADSEDAFVPATLPLPRYEYTGTEEYMAEISDYLIDYYGKETGLDDVDVLIPFGIIAQKDEDNPDDIVVYGSFNVEAFMLRNTTLDADAGAFSYGQFNLSKAEDGTITIKNAQMTETYYDMQDLFSPVDGLLDKINAISDDDKREEEAQCLSRYVNANGLGITQWQEFGKTPIAILNAPETPEDMQLYTFKSTMGYEITYDMRKITLSSIDEYGDMFGRVEEGDFYSGTFMIISKSDENDLEKAIYASESDTGAKDLEFSDVTVGNSYSAKRAEFTGKVDDGREFRYIFYGVDTGSAVYVITLETTVGGNTADIDFKQLDEIFKDMLATFK